MKIEQKFRLASLFDSLGIGLFGPFLTLFAVSLGANPFQVGLLSSLTSLAAAIFNILFFPIFGLSKNKVILYIIFSAIGGIFYLPIAFLNNVNVLILLVSLQSVFFSLSSIAWNSSLLSLIPNWKRGKEIGTLNVYSTIGSLIAYIIGGIVIRKFGFIPYLFYSSFFFTSIISNIFVLDVETNSFSRSKFGFREVIKDDKFLRLILILSVFNVFVGMGGPMFNLHLIKNLNANSYHLAVVSIISLLVSYLFSESIGKACDLLGNRTIIFFGLPFVASYPFLYAIGSTMNWIYLVTFICQLGWVAFNMGVFMYLSELAQENEREKYFAVFNSLTGISLFIGNFLSGYLATIVGIKQTLILSSILRFLCIYLFFLLEKKSGYYIITPMDILSTSKLLSYFDGFFSVYSFIVRESLKEKIENYAYSLSKIFKRR